MHYYNAQLNMPDILKERGIKHQNEIFSILREDSIYFTPL